MTQPDYTTWTLEQLWQHQRALEAQWHALDAQHAALRETYAAVERVIAARVRAAVSDVVLR